MELKLLIDELIDLKISIQIREGKLDIRGSKQSITPEISEKIRKHKAELLEYLEATTSRNYLIENIPVAKISEGYQLSSSQERLWVLSQFEEANIAYNVPKAYILEGGLNFLALEYSFKALLDRHESLRTVFKEDENGQIKQFICPSEDIEFTIEYQDLRQCKNQQKIVKKLVQKEFLKPFNLKLGLLLRVCLLQIEDNKWVFTYVMHHIVSDAWSTGVLLKELLMYYDLYLRNQPNSQVPLRIQYKDYAAWQQDQLSGETLQIHKTYWLKQLEGELPIFELPGYKARPMIKSYNGGKITKKVDKKIIEKLKTLTQESGGTMFMGLLAAVNALLYRYTNQEDIIIGSPMAGREHIDLENQIGFYVNTIALRTQFTGENSFKELVEKVKKITIEAYEHQVYPFNELLEELQINRDISRNALFDVMIDFQKTETENSTKLQNLSSLKVIQYEENQRIPSKFDLTFTFYELGHQMYLHLEYNSDIYKNEFVKQLCNHFEKLLNEMVKNPTKPLHHLNFLSVKEQNKLLIEFNDNTVDYPKNKTVIDLFQEQVEKTPHSIAIVYNQKTISYKELNEKANQFGSYLRKNYNIYADDLIGVSLERSDWMLVAILGILKSGGAYVPIDPNYPEERINYMKVDSQCKAIINSEELKKIIDVIETHSNKNLKSINKSNDLAYIIYTSGTSGNPKGVMVEHESLLHKLLTEINLLGLDQSMITCFNTNYVFDVSILEIIMPLIIGGRIVIPLPSIELVSNDYFDFIIKNKITILQGTPSYFKNILNTDEILHDKNSVLNVCIGGEPFEENILIPLKQSFPKASINNHYGPTETVIDVICNLNIFEFKNNNIGKPIANTQVYILDEILQPLPIGVAGKIYISGAGVARGYLNKPELTAEKFIANPFVEGIRMYDTGDLGRWLPDGTIEFLGRKDSQVKIRGYRIELGEIENTILQFSENIKQVVVEVKENNQDKVLVAYFVSKKSLEVKDIRVYLGKKIPAYMIPSHYVQLQELPLTSNGKIDKKRLPDPESLGTLTEKYVAPTNEIEEKLVLMWQDVLDKKQIGIKDNFFEIGGHSLKAAKLIMRIKKEFNIEIDLRSIFIEPTIEILADTVSNSIWLQTTLIEENDSYDEIIL